MTALPTALRAAFRTAAADLPARDDAAYARHGRDPLEPILGLGPRSARLCLFGRDPGATEVAQGVPFVGKAGQAVRGALHRHQHGSEPAGPDDLLAAGDAVFWLATVPYKPTGNIAWPIAVQRRFQPLVGALLLGAWDGDTVLALGREAFFWFGIGQPPAERQALQAFWGRPDRYDTTLWIDWQLGAAGRRLQLAPLPHPSPANAVWFARFPGLLAARLRALG